MTSDRRRPDSHSTESTAATAVAERRPDNVVGMPVGYYDPDASSFGEVPAIDLDGLTRASLPEPVVAAGAGATATS